MAVQVHEIIEGIVSALYNEKTNLENIIRTIILTPCDELTGVPHGITTIQSYYIKEDDELGARFYDEKGVSRNVHALGLSFMHEKYEGLIPEEAVHALKNEIYEYFSALETYPFMKNIEAKHHEARNNPRKGFGKDDNKIGRRLQG